MNKKMIGGLLALLFVVQAVQVTAISRLSKVADTTSNFVSRQAMISNSHRPQNQMAAVGSALTIDPSPGGGGQGYVLYHNSLGELRCMYVDEVTGGLYHNGIPSNQSQGGMGSSYGCTGASPWLMGGAPPSGDLSVRFDSISKNYVVSGSSVAVMQFRLFLLGYLNLEQVTGIMDSVTKQTLITFQKASGLSQTGVYGTQTQTALNSDVSSIKRFSVISGSTFTFPK